jgi:hypothetical protein
MDASSAVMSAAHGGTLSIHWDGHAWVIDLEPVKDERDSVLPENVTI